MTGAFTVRGVAAQHFKEFKVHDESWPPKWTKLELLFDDGTRLAYSDSRRFGKIQLLDEGVDPHTVPPLSRLAPDPMNNLPAANSFAARIRSKTVVVKAALLDQNFALCGLGNWLVDDILYAARIDPRTRCNTLSDSACDAILRSAASVCAQAVDVSAESERFPKSWLFHQRWGIKKRGGKGKDGAPLRTADGHQIKVTDVAGRTTLWVPAVQKKTTTKNASAKSRVRTKASGTRKKKKQRR